MYLLYRNKKNKNTTRYCHNLFGEKIGKEFFGGLGEEYFWGEQLLALTCTSYSDRCFRPCLLHPGQKNKFSGQLSRGNVPEYNSRIKF